MIDSELLEILVCPQTKQSLRMADENLLEAVNRAIEAGEVRTVGGTEVKTEVESGLVREDGRVLYPVRDDIPILLVDEALEIDSVS